jgi:hypothetical protein
MPHPFAPKMSQISPNDPMYKDLCKGEQDELYRQVKRITEITAELDPNANTTDRINWFIELSQFCYMHTLCMLRLPDLRRAIIKYFEEFFVELASGNPNAQISLGLRDQMNRLYGMMLENKRNLEKDPLCLF